MPTRILPLVAVWIAAVAVAAGSAQQPQLPAPRTAAPAAGAARAAAPPSDAAFVKQYCATCHNERAKQGGLSLEALDVASVAGHAETWEKVVRKVKTGMMPPSGAQRPERATLDAFARALEG